GPDGPIGSPRSRPPDAREGRTPRWVRPSSSVCGPLRSVTRMSVVAEALLPALASAHLAGHDLCGALLVPRLHRGRLRRARGALGLGLLTVTVLVLGHGDASCGGLGARAGFRFTQSDDPRMSDNYRA